MAHLQKLRISGFRSFGESDDDAGKMSFLNLESKRVWPLTLILGQNGCGKTTIIECLRYATTGDTPPGSGGGKSFVHDPKMAEKTKVKGCVKLVFQVGFAWNWFHSPTLFKLFFFREMMAKHITCPASWKRLKTPRNYLSKRWTEVSQGRTETLGIPSGQNVRISIRLSSITWACQSPFWTTSFSVIRLEKFCVIENVNNCSNFFFRRIPIGLWKKGARSRPSLTRFSIRPSTNKC